jgi:hypothetical protein
VAFKPVLIGGAGRRMLGFIAPPPLLTNTLFEADILRPCPQHDIARSKQIVEQVAEGGDGTEITERITSSI